MSNDQSPENKTHEKLLEQYTEIATLAGGLAHEIRNPLSTISLNLELLAEDFTDTNNPKEHRALQKIEKLLNECERLQEILDDFLNFAKIQTEKLQVTDINQSLTKVIDFIRLQSQQANVDIIPYFANDLPSVRLDQESFKGAILNLVLNAQQAMPEGGQLMIRTSIEDNRIKIDLIDSGVGMDEKTLGKIFKAFFSKRMHGSGLGLPTVKKIIEAHHGTLEVKSEPGKGTQFTIWLDAVESEPAKAETKE